MLPCYQPTEGGQNWCEKHYWSDLLNFDEYGYFLNSLIGVPNMKYLTKQPDTES